MTKPPSTPTRTSPKFDLRLPDDMRERVALVAKEEGRSMNSQIVAYVAEGLDRSNQTARSLKDINDKLDRLMELVASKK